MRQQYLIEMLVAEQCGRMHNVEDALLLAQGMLDHIRELISSDQDFPCHGCG
jgi:hypothetical protein